MGRLFDGSPLDGSPGDPLGPLRFRTMTPSLGCVQDRRDLDFGMPHIFLHNLHLVLRHERRFRIERCAHGAELTETRSNCAENVGHKSIEVRAVLGTTCRGVKVPESSPLPWMEGVAKKAVKRGFVKRAPS